MKRIVLFILLGLLIGGSFILYSMAQTPLQPYKTLGKKGNIEFRYYPSAYLASITQNETSYRGAANRGFRVLADYIFGNNKTNQSIAMTAPVHMAFDSGRTTMSFVMPEGYTLDNLPKPVSSSVTIHPSKEEYVAVLRFGGWASDEVINEKRAQLEKELAAIGIKPIGNVRFLGYNAPWDVFFRRNEVVFPLDPSSLSKFDFNH